MQTLGLISAKKDIFRRLSSTVSLTPCVGLKIYKTKVYTPIQICRDICARFPVCGRYVKLN